MHVLFYYILFAQTSGSGLLRLLTGEVKESVEDIEAVCVSTLDEFVRVHLSDVRSEQK